MFTLMVIHKPANAEKHVNNLATNVVMLNTKIKITEITKQMVFIKRISVQSKYLNLKWVM